MASLYDFTVKNQQGEDVSLADYQGRVLLIVNTASMKLYKNQIEDFIARCEGELEKRT